MKRKFLLATILVAILVCLFAISASAAATNEFGTVETKDTVDLTGMATDDDVYVVLYDGNEYHTYPSRYIVTNAKSITFNFEKINEAFSKGYDITSIIRLQVPSHVTKFEGVFAYGKNPNIVELNFPSDSDLTTFSYGTFENCSLLEKINIPAKTTSLGGHMFNVCTSLKDVTFDDGFAMTSLPNSMFKACSSLKTVVIPNSVTTLNGATFYNCTSIEKVVFGANLTTVGTDEFACVGSGTNAVKLYVPASLFASAETIPSRVYSWDKNHMVNVTYYFTGTKLEAEAIIAKAEFVNIKNATVVAWDEEKGENHADYVVSGSNVFVYGYSSCEAFYGGVHTEPNDIKCVAPCTVCGKLLTAENPSHTTVNNCVYENGYLYEGKYTITCAVELCEYCVDMGKLDAIIEFVGYSTPEKNADRLTVSYGINQKARAKYNELTNSDISIGVVASFMTEGENLEPVIIENGEAKANYEKTVCIPVDSEYYGIDFILSGFITGENNYCDTPLVLCAYVLDGENVDYICFDAEYNKIQSEYASTVTLNQFA